MRGIVYNGVDLSDVCGAEVVEKVALPVLPDVMAVPGRAGALLVSGRVPPRLVRVRLYLDTGYKLDAGTAATIRHRLYATLCATSGGTLVLPDEPELEYHDAVCTDADTWSSLFEDGHGDVTFTLYDPVAYGSARAETTDVFEVGGTWPTWPTFSLVATAGSAVRVTDDVSGAYVLVEHEFAGGETVVINCASEAVTINGADSSADVALGSDFFSLNPGSAELGFSGCSSHLTAFRERWL